MDGLEWLQTFSSNWFQVFADDFGWLRMVLIGFGWFWIVLGGCRSFRLVVDGFWWFHVVCCFSSYFRKSYLAVFQLSTICYQIIAFFSEISSIWRFDFLWKIGCNRLDESSLIWNTFLIQFCKVVFFRCSQSETDKFLYLQNIFFNFVSSVFPKTFSQPVSCYDYLWILILHNFF